MGAVSMQALSVDDSMPCVVHSLLMKTHHRTSVRAGTISVVVNALLFGAKLWVGLVTGSVAIVADAWHTLSDSLSSIVVIVGAVVAGKPQDDDHPFGHQRAEWIAALIIAVLLGVVAFHFAVDSVDRLLAGISVEYGTAAVLVTAASVLIKEALAQYCFFGARRNNSEALRADGWHHRSDAGSSAIILVAIVFGRQLPWIDPVLGLIVALLIFITAVTLFKRVGSLVLGESPDSDLVKNLSRLANREAGCDVFLHHVHQHTYGDHREVTMHIRLDNEMQLDKAHAVVDAIENCMRQELDIEPTIHVEPQRKTGI